MFVPIAERHGLIAALGHWVIEDACRQARAWRDAGLRMRVAINLSAYQLRREDLVDRLLEAQSRHGVRPAQFTCEITETVAMEDTLVTKRAFERLGAAGMHVSIDDFGTGYSSLAYLRQLPVQELKIDRSFVTDLATSDDARARSVEPRDGDAASIATLVITELNRIGRESRPRDLGALAIDADRFGDERDGRRGARKHIGLLAGDDADRALGAARARGRERTKRDKNAEPHRRDIVSTKAQQSWPSLSWPDNR